VKLADTAIAGAVTIELEPLVDERGFFARTFCRREFEARGLESRIAQENISYNARRGTLRGLHYQIAPHEEVKVVSCLAGAIFDVIVDLRPASPSYGRWTAVELSAENRLRLYIPAGVAHGFQTLADHTTVGYQMSEFFAPAAARGVRWDDPTLAIPWPIVPPIISARDAAFEGFPCASS
jgi:dTDP-4-dehydrorhamnose 3,5-epimerase